VTVTKTVGEGIIRRLTELGANDLGENRVAAAEPKIAALPGPTWHLIGHLQQNKVRRAVRLFPWIHSIDSIALLERVARIAREEDRRPRVLLQVEISGEPDRHGVSIENAPALAEFAATAEVSNSVETVGMMGMASLVEDPEDARPAFRGLRELRDELAPRFPSGLPHLSMGMTNDFEVAIEEGSTMVRVGRALVAGATEDTENSKG